MNSANPPPSPRPMPVVARRVGVLLSSWVFGSCWMAACGGTAAIGLPPASDGGPPDATALEDGPLVQGAAGDAAPRQTDGGACPSSPEPFKGCVTVTDCTLAIVPSCCGVPQWIGIAAAAAADYSSCYPTLDCRGLGCAGSSDCSAEDGQTADCRFDQSALRVACRAGQCVSYVAPAEPDSGP
jgi:hypothetical protein